MNLEGRYAGLGSDDVQNITATSKPQPLRADAVGPRDRSSASTTRARHRAARRGPGARAVDQGAARRRRRGDRGLAAVVLPQPGARAAVAASWSHEIGPGRLRRRCPATSARGSGSTPRNVTTIMSTQVGPRLRDYLEPLRARPRRAAGFAGPLLVMQGSGGAVAAEDAPGHAITTIGSVLTGGRGRGTHPRPPARPRQHHLHRHRRHDVPGRAGGRRRTGRPPPDRRSTSTSSTCRW